MDPAGRDPGANSPPDPSGGVRRDPAALARLNALLEAGLALAPAQRADWLANLAAEDRPHAQRLAALLARAGVETDTFLRRPLAAALDAPGRLDESLDRPGDEVGPYRLIRELGAGGMATVWLAERADGLLQRQVALKLPREGWARGLAQRMARERDILGALAHPHIARLYDAGVTAAGRPWLAMECVSGEPIDDYCRARRLDVVQRLRLFAQVAEAVAHAHARLIVHRDLKPGNILVTPQGEVSLLDFGVAKLLADDGAEGGASGALTQVIGSAFTPDYAAPEQMSGQPVGVAADVYALGIVLYELLTGERPYRLTGHSATSLEQAILAAEVPLPSSRVGNDRRLARQLRGDLDSIVCKALRKRPEHRYPSVESFAADLRRHLDGEPVLAQPRGRAYRTAKFVRRHRWPIGAAGAVAAALLLGLGAALWQAHEADRQRDRALARLSRNEAVADFVHLMFTEGVPPGREAVAQEMLQRSEAFVAKGYGSDAGHEAAVLSMLAANHVMLGDPSQAEPLLDRAATLLRDSPDRDQRAQVDCDRSLVLGFAGRTDEAIRLLEPWLEDRGIDAGVAAACMQRRTEHAQDLRDAPAALLWAERALTRQREARFTPPTRLALLEGERARALSLNGRGDEADRAFETALAGYTAAGRGDSSHALLLRGNWAIARLYAGDVRGSLELSCDAMRLHARLSGGQAGAPYVSNCASAMERMARFEEALALYDQALAVIGDNTMWRVIVHTGQATTRLQRGELDAARTALAAARQALAGGGFPARHSIVLGLAIAEARWQLAAGEPGAAREGLTGVVEAFAAQKTRNSSAVHALRYRAEAAAALRDWPAALADARAALALAQALQGARPGSFHHGQAALTLAQVQAGSGDAAAARATALSARQQLASSAGEDHPQTRAASDLLARL